VPCYCFETFRTQKEVQVSNPQIDRNLGIIKEFRDNSGKVGGPFAGRTLLLLHTIGAKSSQPRIIRLLHPRWGLPGDHSIQRRRPHQPGLVLQPAGSSAGNGGNRIESFRPKQPLRSNRTKPFVQPDGRDDARLAEYQPKDHPRNPGNRANACVMKGRKKYCKWF